MVRKKAETAEKYNIPPSSPLPFLSPSPLPLPATSHTPPPPPPRRFTQGNFRVALLLWNPRWSRQEAAGSPAPGMAPSRPYDGCHGAGDGPPPQRAAGGGVERGGGARGVRWPTGPEATSPWDAAGASCGGCRAAGARSRGRLRGCQDSSHVVGSAIVGRLACEAIDGQTLRYLLKMNLARKEEEEERRRALFSSSRSVRRKRKKKRKKRLPWTCGRARHRQRQWLAPDWFSVFPSYVGRPKLPGIMDGMDQNDSLLRSSSTPAGFAGISPRAVPSVLVDRSAKLGIMAGMHQ